MNKHVVKYYFTQYTGLYGKSLSCVLDLVADNENLNKALARVLKVPMVGCASHRLNLAVNMFMNNYEDLLDKIHATMLKMSSLKKSGALRKLTPLRPVLRNKTRCNTGSNFAKGLLQAKRLKTGDSGYVSLQWVPGTSNVCERLFSRAKLNMGICATI